MRNPVLTLNFKEFFCEGSLFQYNSNVIAMSKRRHVLSTSFKPDYTEAQYRGDSFKSPSRWGQFELSCWDNVADGQELLFVRSLDVSAFIRYVRC